MKTVSLLVCVVAVSLGLSVTPRRVFLTTTTAAASFLAGPCVAATSQELQGMLKSTQKEIEQGGAIKREPAVGKAPKAPASGALKIDLDVGSVAKNAQAQGRVRFVLDTSN